MALGRRATLPLFRFCWCGTRGMLLFFLFFFGCVAARCDSDTLVPQSRHACAATFQGRVSAPDVGEFVHGTGEASDALAL